MPDGLGKVRGINLQIYNADEVVVQKTHIVGHAMTYDRVALEITETDGTVHRVTIYGDTDVSVDYAKREDKTHDVARFDRGGE